MSQKYTEKKAMAHVKMVTIFFLNSIVDKFYIFLGLVFHSITFPSTNLFFTNNFVYKLVTSKILSLPNGHWSSAEL